MHQAPGRVGQEPGDIGDGRLVAVDDPEAVGHVEVRQRGQLGRQGLSLLGHLAGLAGVEPDVLQQHHVTGLLGGHHGRGIRERHQRHGGAEQLTQSRSDRRKAELGNLLPLGPAEVRGDDDARPLPTQVLQRGKGRDDAPVIGDHAGAISPVGQGDVEVRPDQDGAPGDVEVVE